MVWPALYNRPGNAADPAAAVAVSPDGSTVFVTGQSAGTTSGDDYATRAYNAATGASVWTARYNGPGNAHDAATAIAVSPDSAKVFVTGQSAGTTSGDDYATRAYKA